MSNENETDKQKTQTLILSPLSPPLSVEKTSNYYKMKMNDNKNIVTEETSKNSYAYKSTKGRDTSNTMQDAMIETH